MESRILIKVHFHFEKYLLFVLSSSFINEVYEFIYQPTRDK